jgi:hypothetical protein
LGDDNFNSAVPIVTGAPGPNGKLAGMVSDPCFAENAKDAAAGNGTLGKPKGASDAR